MMRMNRQRLREPHTEPPSSLISGCIEPPTVCVTNTGLRRRVLKLPKPSSSSLMIIQACPSQWLWPASCSIA
ncbi:hypothetical protein FOPG_19665 [Fusarium oxysporum f. sp. conglutinans race 2 54008]|uniref:Uncharacterized protein n=1 Tax=Fusarium oxysporum f. sp. conglutinans race 2 54008 TaxID=1089457 RepID=X0HS93_FUSOX|nr:hypothetical protein FOPG_19665 [Fusarium oxysporum f. sp. conglutinans race 2 54008]